MKKFLTAVLTAILCAAFFCGCSVNGKITFNDETLENEDAYTIGGGTVTGDIKNINVNWVNGNVNFILTDSDSIVIEETCSKELPENLKVRFLAEGDTLNINFCKSGFSFSESDNYNKILNINIPNKDYNLINIDTVSGDVAIPELKAEGVMVNAVSAFVGLTDTKLNSLDINTVSGNVYYSTLQLPKRISFDGVSADLGLNIPQDAGFIINMDSVSGHVNSNFPITVADEIATNGDKSCDISIDSVSGNVVITEYATDPTDAGRGNDDGKLI